jgi:hypothetical protein
VLSAGAAPIDFENLKMNALQRKIDLSGARNVARPVTVRLRPNPGQRKQWKLYREHVQNAQVGISGAYGGRCRKSSFLTTAWKNQLARIQ